MSNFYVFATYDCKTSPSLQVLGGELEREKIGIYVAIFDFFIMITSLFGLHLMNKWVERDSWRHRNLLFETQEFSVFIWDLPKMKNSYKIENMKVDLINHIIHNIKKSHQ